MWEEALIVAILVAFTAHLEGDALSASPQRNAGGARPTYRARHADSRALHAFNSNRHRQAAVSKPAAFSLNHGGSSAPLLGADGCALPDPDAAYEEVPIELVRKRRPASKFEAEN